MQYRSQWLLKFLSTGRRKLFFHMTGSSKRPVNSTRILTWNGSAQEKECWAYLFSDESRTMSKDRCCRFKRHRFTDLFEQVEQQKMFSAVKLYSRYFLRNGMSLFFLKKKRPFSPRSLYFVKQREASRVPGFHYPSWENSEGARATHFFCAYPVRLYTKLPTKTRNSQTWDRFPTLSRSASTDSLVPFSIGRWCTSGSFDGRRVTWVPMRFH